MMAGCPLRLWVVYWQVTYDSIWGTLHPLHAACFLPAAIPQKENIMLKLFLPIVLALATFVGSGEIIHACVTNGTGAVRIVSAETTCNADETALEWGVVGLQGPQGATGPAGPQGPAGALARFLVVPKTGQTMCYDTSDNVVIPCTGTGQDGAYQTGSLPALAPTGGMTGAYNTPAWTGVRFTDNGDGTVTDNLTGLIWLRNANCFGVEPWATALSDANNLAHGDCNLSDGSSAGQWRLPNVNELHSLIDLTQSNLALPANHPFTGVQSSFYWTRTSNADCSSSAWGVGLYDGGVSLAGKTSTYYMWPVRGGQ